MELEATIKRQLEAIFPHLDERQRRLSAASVAKAVGHGGVSLVSRACGLSRVTITKGIKELDEPPIKDGRIHKPGAGRPTLESKYPHLISDFKNIIEETTRGDPETPRLWTCKSTTNIANELQKIGYSIGREIVGKLLHQSGYSLQANKKTEEGKQYPDRDAQFKYINALIKEYMLLNEPVISVDAKKKELVGNYYNQSQKWLPKKQPILVQGHDFSDPSVPRAFPYGIYDIKLNNSFVNIGTDHDTGAFAVASIRGWWINQGRFEYPNITKLLITTDGGGSNGSRLRAWKFELQKLAEEISVPIQVCHFPPSTSKWNKIEHRLFSFISSNWRGEPLIDYETIVNLITSTKTVQCLSVKCRLDHTKYSISQKITDAEIAQVRLVRADFHGEWNYQIFPRNCEV